MSKKKKTKKSIQRTRDIKASEKKEKAPGFLQQGRLGLRLLALALFPFADVFQKLNLEWLALLCLLGSALVFYEMLDHYRKTRHWREFSLVLFFYILAFGSLMVAIYLHQSWAHSSNIFWKILFTLPRLLGASYLLKTLPRIYPYR